MLSNYSKYPFTVRLVFGGLRSFPFGAERVTRLSLHIILVTFNMSCTVIKFPRVQY